jgi:hypothetical protein
MADPTVKWFSNGKGYLQGARVSDDAEAGPEGRRDVSVEQL